MYIPTVPARGASTRGCGRRIRQGAVILSIRATLHRTALYTCYSEVHYMSRDDFLQRALNLFISFIPLPDPARVRLTGPDLDLRYPELHFRDVCITAPTSYPSRLYLHLPRSGVRTRLFIRQSTPSVSCIGSSRVFLEYHGICERRLRCRETCPGGGWSSSFVRTFVSDELVQSTDWLTD